MFSMLSAKLRNKLNYPLSLLLILLITIFLLIIPAQVAHAEGESADSSAAADTTGTQESGGGDSGAAESGSLNSDNSTNETASIQNPPNLSEPQSSAGSEDYTEQGSAPTDTSDVTQTNEPPAPEPESEGEEQGGLNNSDPDSSDNSGESDLDESGEAPGEEDETGDFLADGDSESGEPDEEAPEGNSYVAEIPDEQRVVSVDAQEQSFTVTFTEKNEGGQTLGSAQVIIPEGFQNVTFAGINVEVQDGNGPKYWSHSIVLDGLLTYLNLFANSFDDYLGFGESVSIGFTADTPATPGVYTFETKAWTDARDSEGNVLVDGGSETGDAVGTTVNNPHADHREPTVSVNQGLGTDDNPFIVEKTEQLDHISYRPDAFYSIRGEHTLQDHLTVKAKSITI